MNNIIDWEYYSSLYDDIKETEFEAAEAKAEKAVRQVIGPVKWATITSATFGFDVLQDCLCKVINQQKSDEAAGVGKGISSVSNDGYSESYALAEAKDAEASLKASIIIWLSGTGLIGAY